MVTCNQTDDTVHDDELSNSLASNCCDYNHGSYYLTKQIHNRQNRFACAQNGANQDLQMQNRFSYHPMLPPVEHGWNPLHLQQQNALVDYHHHQMCLQHTQVNASFNQPAYQRVETTHQRNSI